MDIIKTVCVSVCADMKPQRTKTCKPILRAFAFSLVFCLLWLWAWRAFDHCSVSLPSFASINTQTHMHSAAGPFIHFTSFYLSQPWLLERARRRAEALASWKSASTSRTSDTDTCAAAVMMMWCGGLVWL